MLTRSTPATIVADLTVKGQGKTESFQVVYFNRSPDDYDAKTRELAAELETADNKVFDSIRLSNAKLVQYVVKEFESEYDLSTDNLIEMDKAMPGVLVGIIKGFHKARSVEVEKN